LGKLQAVLVLEAQILDGAILEGWAAKYCSLPSGSCREKWHCNQGKIWMKQVWACVSCWGLYWLIQTLFWREQGW
jgi:hypothetical protein